MNNHIGLNGNSLHRLDDSTTTEGGQSLVKDYNYDALGNLTFKTGIGSYVYNYTNGRPHAPTSIGTKTQTYDANGNQTGGWNFTLGQNRVISNWSSYNQPKTFLLSGVPLTFLNFYYDANRQRFKQHNSNSGKVTLYIAASTRRRPRAAR